MSVQPWKAKIYVATWNVGSNNLENLDLHSLLGLRNKPENDLHHPDLYVVGLQEIEHDLVKGDHWTDKFAELLKTRGYVMVNTQHLQGLVLILFTQRRHLLHIHQVETENERTGIGSVWGNKGALSIRFSFYGCSVCIVNAHLAAHDEELEERIKDFEEIVEESNFHIKNTMDIFSHDYVIWFGDLNFRLAGESTPEHIRDLIQSNKLEELLIQDQLTSLRKQGRAFTELNEKTPTFPPTFKFKPQTCEYDLKRRPAWTDRILYKEPKNAELSVEQSSYRSHPEYDVSDHKPVTSELHFKIIKNLNETIIEFSPIHAWLIGEENFIRYVLSRNFEEKENDWIGIFKENFTNLDEFIAREHTSRKVKIDKVPGDRTYELQFPDNVKLSENERYVLLYSQTTGRIGLRRVTGVVGMTDAFKAERPKTKGRGKQRSSSRFWSCLK